MRTPKVLVISTFSDESQINDQKKIVASQKNYEIEHIIIEGLSKVDSQKEFHNLAYKLQNNFQYIIKLDADMVPSNNNTFEKIIDILEKNSAIRLTIPVFDFFTNDFIMGMHIIKSPNIPKKYYIDETNTDGWIGLIPGKSLFFTNEIHIYHGFNPSIQQSVRFGLHRGLKSSKDPNNGQWLTLIQLFNNWNTNSQKEIGYSVLGALAGLGFLKNEDISWDFLDSKSERFLELCDEIKVTDLNYLIKDRFNRKKLSINYFHFNKFQSSLTILYLWLRYFYNFKFIKFFMYSKNTYSRILGKK